MPFGLAISTERAKALEVIAYYWVSINRTYSLNVLTERHPR